jgi:hypothetical protein
MSTFMARLGFLLSTAFCLAIITGVAVGADFNRPPARFPSAQTLPGLDVRLNEKFQPWKPQAPLFVVPNRQATFGAPQNPKPVVRIS